MPMPPPPEPGPPITAASIRKAIWAAARKTGPEEPGEATEVTSDWMQAFVEHLEEILDYPLWLGEADIFHDNEPSLVEVVEALCEAANLYGVLIVEE